MGSTGVESRHRVQGNFLQPLRISFLVRAVALQHSVDDIRAVPPYIRVPENLVVLEDHQSFTEVNSISRWQFGFSCSWVKTLGGFPAHLLVTLRVRITDLCLATPNLMSIHVDMKYSIRVSISLLTFEQIFMAVFCFMVTDMAEELQVEVSHA